MTAAQSGWLARILAAKQAELPTLRRLELPRSPGPRAFSLRRTGVVGLIGEIKFRSPSAGALSTVLTVAERASLYEKCGASMISVLCDRAFFGGAFSHLREARGACSLPLLCKEFVIDEIQLDLAAAYGADAVLLIVRCLSPARVTALVREARARKLTPFVEVVSEHEAELALDAGATLIGVNARNLDTLEMDAGRAARVLARLPPDVTRVHLSGVATPSDVRRIASSAVDAILLGEVLMRHDQPGDLLHSLALAAKGPTAHS